MKFLLLIIALFSIQAFAEESEGLTIYPQVGQTFMDSGTDLDNDTLLGIGVGYRFDSPWAIEFTYQQTEADFESPRTGDVDVDVWHIGGLYHLQQRNNFLPFLSAGIGAGEYDIPTGDADETQINVGAGFKWFFTEKAALRSDLKLFQGSEDDAVDAALYVGLHYAFGGSKAAPVAIAAAAPVESDADSDGVLDAMDKCPNTPLGYKVDKNGCHLDTDGDGVYDYMDDCPNTTNRRAKVDSKGCYMTLQEKVHFELNVEFDFDSSAARPEHTAEVKKVADMMEEYPGSSVTMEGHTDSMGDATYNQRLSEQRAKTIADMLTEKFGISASRVESNGKGESEPRSSNETAAGRQENRRVTAIVEGKKDSIEMK